MLGVEEFEISTFNMHMEYTHDMSTGIDCILVMLSFFGIFSIHLICVYLN